MSLSLRSTITLNDGVKMPLFGLGLFKSSQGKECEDAVQHALKSGYRLLDSAHLYQNEESTGTGLRNSGLPREDVFVVTKVWMDDHGEEKTTAAVEASLQRMNIGHIDLYLIHDPRGEKLVETYKTLLNYKDKGLIRSVGVSNFGIQHLEGLKAAGLPAPSVNQIELHPWQNLLKSPLIEYCQKNNIAVMGYCPLMQNQKANDPAVVAMAKKYNKTWAQVLIRWSVQRGFITIPKSTNPKRIEENADVFDFVLSDEDMDTLNSMPHAEVIWDRTAVPFVD